MGYYIQVQAVNYNEIFFVNKSLLKKQKFARNISIPNLLIGVEIFLVN